MGTGGSRVGSGYGPPARVGRARRHRADGPERPGEGLRADHRRQAAALRRRRAAAGHGEDIRGLRNGESLVGIDFRPSGLEATQGWLYGLGDTGYIYTINARTATASRGAQITADGAPVVLRGESFGIDFNPTVDRLRIVSDANQNLRVNVDTGALSDFDATVPGTQPDLDLQYAAGHPNTGQEPAVTGVAYRNSAPEALGTTNTELYDIDLGTEDATRIGSIGRGSMVEGLAIPIGHR